MSESIKTGSEFDFTKIKYGSPRTSDKGGKNVKIIDQETGQWLCITTPFMTSFGIGDYVDKDTKVGNGRYEISLLFPQSDYETPETTAFLEGLRVLENKIKADALKYSKEWFGKVHKSAEVLEALWTPMVKMAKDKVTGDYDTTRLSIKGKVHKNVDRDTKEEKWRCELYNEDGDIMYPDDENPLLTPLEILPSGKKSTTACVLTCGGIWFTNGKFTVTFEVNQIVAQKPREQTLGKRTCLIKIKPSDKAKMAESAVTEVIGDCEDNYTDEDKNVNVSTSKDYISDGEEDEGEVEVQQAESVSTPEPVAAPVVAEKKKVVRKKV